MPSSCAETAAASQSSPRSTSVEACSTSWPRSFESRAVSTQARASASEGSAPNPCVERIDVVERAPVERRAIAVECGLALRQRLPAVDIGADVRRVALREQRVELRLVGGLHEHDRLLVRGHDDDELGADRGPDVVRPVDALLAESRADRPRHAVLRAGDALEEARGVLPLLRALVRHHRHVGERVGRGERRRLRDRGGGRLRARAARDEHEGAEKAERRRARAAACPDGIGPAGRKLNSRSVG